MLNRVSIGFFASLCLPAVLSATTYNCVTYSVPGASSTDISGINNSGIVVGTYFVGSTGHGFIADPSSGNFQTVDYPGAANTRLLTINNNGVATGQYYGQSGGYFTLDASGNFNAITVPPPYTLLQAYGINDAGGISVLVQSSPGAPSFGILNPDGTLTSVPSPPGFGSGPGDSLASVNNALQMLEVNTAYGGAYLADSAGNLTPVSFPGAYRNYGYGLNNNGMVVGFTSYLTEGPYMGFSLDASGAYLEVLCPGVRFFSQRAWRAVNDNGLVAGGTYIGTPLPGDPQVTLSANNLTFPPIPVGQTSDPQYVTVTNSGDARLDIAGISSSSSDFQVSGCLDPTTQTASLDPGANCTLTVTATPMAPGTRTGTISMSDSAAGAPHRIALSVTGVVPPPSCQLTSIDPGPPAQANFTMQDTNSGLQSILLVDSSNANVNIPPFSPGTTDPVAVTATQIDSSQSSQADFQVTNVAGATATCGTSFGGPGSRPAIRSARARRR